MCKRWNENFQPCDRPAVFTDGVILTELKTNAYTRPQMDTAVTKVYVYRMTTLVTQTCTVIG